MTLTDSGPLIALQNRNDVYHARCLEAFPNIQKPLITTLPAVTETMHFLGKSLGWAGQERLWRLIRHGELKIAPLDDTMLIRMDELMERYRDSPMDFADASLIATAEARGLRQIFTLDSHFNAYKPLHMKKLEVIPKV